MVNRLFSSDLVLLMIRRPHSVRVDAQPKTIHFINTTKKNKTNFKKQPKFQTNAQTQSDNAGVLVLSEFAGAAQSLGAGAILVNTWNVADVAQVCVIVGWL